MTWNAHVWHGPTRPRCVIEVSCTVNGFGSPKQNLYDVNTPIKSCGMPEVAILSPLASQLRNLHFVVIGKEVAIFIFFDKLKSDSENSRRKLRLFQPLDCRSPDLVFETSTQT